MPYEDYSKSQRANYRHEQSYFTYSWESHESRLQLGEKTCRAAIVNPIPACAKE